MPAYSSSTVVEKQMDLVVWVGNDTQVNLTIDSGIYVPHEDFDSHATRHAAGGDDPITPASIGAAPDGFGLGKKGQHYYPYTENELNENLDNFLRTMTDGGTGFCVVSDNSGAVMGGGTYGVYVFKHDNDYATAEFFGFIYNGARFSKAKWAGIWGGLRSTGPDAFAPAGYGLGGLSKFLYSVDDLNNITKNGWYCWQADVPANAPATWGNMFVTCQDGHYSQMVYLFSNPGCVIQRTGIGGTWSNWEYVNPPMETGKEFRTTERYKGKAVYKKVDANGNILWRAENETSWHLLSSSDFIATATVE